MRLDAGAEAVVERRSQLRQAIEEDWDLGPDRWPVPPGTATVHALKVDPTPSTDLEVAAESGGQIVDLFDRRPAGTERTRQPAAEEVPEPEQQPVVVGDLGVGRARFEGLGDGPTPLETFDELAAWFATEMAQTTSKRTRRRRGANTLGNVDKDMRIAANHFRGVAAEAGGRSVSLPLRGPDAISEQDCIDFLTFRKHTNLQTRSRNETRLRDWASRVERATTTGGPVPPAPELEEEIVEVATIAAAAKTVAAAFTGAFVDGLIPSQPWTERVRRRVEAPPLTHHSQRPLPNPETLAVIVAELAQIERRIIVDGKATTVTGERYVMFVDLTEQFHLRPEEARAIRRSCLRRDDTLGRHLVIADSIVFVSSRFAADGASTQVQGLKARPEGDVRILFADDAFFDRLEDHLDRFVPDVDPTSADVDVADPLVFTTHGGAVIAPGPFNQHWWRPAVAAATETVPELSGFQFRQLRHTGITRRILAGDSIDAIADDAGNTPEVIRAHYRGVIDGVERSPAQRSPERPGTGERLVQLASPDLTVDDAEALLAALDDRQLDSLHKRVKAVRGMRSDD
jgi:hypothetical protein